MHLSFCFVLISTVCLGNIRGVEQHVDNARKLYEEFKRTYGKAYTNDDDERRFVVFKSNLMQAKAYQEMERGTAQYGVTQFSDLTDEEFEANYLTLKYDKDSSKRLERPIADYGEQAPASFDWHEHGAVGPVVNQGHCGSCWAFSVIGNIEGQWFLKTGELLKLSEQQLLDCDQVDRGCHGGYPTRTFGEIRRLGGLELDSDYPYLAREGRCQMNDTKIRVRVNDSYSLPVDEVKQVTSLWKLGPLASALNAGMLKYYRSGVMYPWRILCNPWKLNHAVLTIGYGTEGNLPYWKVKNSWGSSFGEKGYFRIHRGSGSCGINSEVSTSIVA